MTTNQNKGCASGRLQAKHPNQANVSQGSGIPVASKWEKIKYLIICVFFVILATVAINLFIARIWGLSNN